MTAVRQRETVKIDARQASFQFVRNVLQVSFSVIFYLRSKIDNLKKKKKKKNSTSKLNIILKKDIFHEDDFAADTFADVPVKILRPKSAHAKVRLFFFRFRAKI
jgi:hypothetical protein